jgi:hypothetical protein
MRVQLLSDGAGERPALPSTGIPTPEHACQPVRTAGRQRGYPGQTTPFTTFTLPLSRGVRIITKVFVTPAITFADLLLSASQAVRWWGANRPRRAKREKNERKEVIIHPLLLSTTSPPPLHLSSSLSSFNLQLALAAAHPVIIACPISPLRVWWAGLPHSPPARSPFRPRGVVVSVVVAPPTPFSQPRKDFLPPAEGSQPSTPSSDSPNRPLHELSTSPLDDRDRQRPRLAAWPTANAAGLTCPSTSPT